MSVVREFSKELQRAELSREWIEDALSHKWVMATLTVVPSAVLFFLIVVLPITWAFVSAFYKIPVYSPNWEWAGLENFQIIFSDPDFYASFWRNLIFAGGSIFVHVVAGTGFAVLLNRDFRFNNIAMPIGMMPYLVPSVILGFIALWMGNQSFGIINQILLWTGVISPDGMIAWFTADGTLAMFSLIITNSWKFSIFVTILVLARLQSIPEDLYEAAKMSGASRYQLFRDITFPNIKNVLFIVILIRGVWNFNKFDIIWVLTGGGPVDATTTLPIYAYEMAFLSHRLGRASAVSVVLFGVLSLAAIVYFHVAEPSKEVRVE